MREKWILFVQKAEKSQPLKGEGEKLVQYKRSVMSLE